MDKSKRSDLLAAGRKKLRQFRQKKDQKGGGKDGQSSSNGIKLEKDVDPGELTKMIPEPDPATLTSAVDSDASATDSLDLSSAVHHVDLRGVDSAEVVVQGSQDEGGDAEQAPIELPVVSEGSSLAFEIVHEEVRPPGLKQHDDETSEVGISVVDDETHEAGGNVLMVALDTDTEEQGATAADPGSGLEAAQDVVGLPYLPCERNEVQGDPVNSAENSGITVLGIGSGKEDHEMEKIEVQTDVIASKNLEAERAPEACGFPILTEESQELGANFYHKHDEMAAQVSSDRIISLEDSSEMSLPYLDTSIKNTSAEGLTPRHHVVPNRSTSLGEKSEVPYLVANDKDISAIQNLEMASSKTGTSDESIQIEEYSENPSSSQLTSDNTVSLRENMEIPCLLETDSTQEKEEISAMVDGESLRTTVEEKSLHQTALEEVVHVQCRSSGELPEEISSSPQEMVEELKEKDYYPMSGSTVSVSSSVECYMLNRVVHDGVADELEKFTRYLYLTSVARDFLQFQLVEQTELNHEICKRSSVEHSKLQGFLQETHRNNTVLNEELAQCRYELGAMHAVKEELEIRLLSKNEEFEVLNNNFLELQSSLKVSQQELVQLSSELAACRCSLETVQKENVNLITSLTLETDLRKKIEEEKEFLASQNANLASDLLEQKERLCTALDKQNQLECITKETGSYFEQLAEDNLYLSSSLSLHIAKLKEVEAEHFGSALLFKEAEFQENDYHAERVAPHDVAEDLQSTKRTSGVSCHGQSPLLHKVDNEQFDSFSTLGVLNGHVQHAKDILQNLENSIEGLHLYSVLSSRSDGRAGASGVSKLIKAFESKQNTEIASEEVHVSRGGLSNDSYALSKEQTSSLRGTIEQIELEIGKAEVHMDREWNRRTISKSFQMDSQSLKQKSDSIQAKIDELVGNMPKNSCRIEDLQNQFDEIQQDVHDQAMKIYSQVELLKNEMNDKFLISNQERDSIMDAILGAIEKLNKYTASQISDNCDVGSHVMASVDAATKSFVNLHEKLDAANLKYNTLHDSYNEQNKLLSTVLERNEFSASQMHKMYVSLWEHLYESHKSIGTADAGMKADEIFLLLPERYEMLIMHLRKLLDERLLFISKNNELESVLLTKNKEIQDLNKYSDASAKKLEDLQHAKNGLEAILKKKDEEFEESNKKCLDLASKLDCCGSKFDLCAPKLAESAKVTQMSDSMNNDSFSSLMQLEALIGSHIQEHEGTIEQLKLSKKCLLEVNIFPEISYDNLSLPLPMLLKVDFIPKVMELQAQLDSLCVSDIKHEIDLQFFKEYIGMMKEALEASRSELHLKALELEQSEQRLSSVREKLSIAVAKGKGLIVQRDSLKHSLAEKSSELEKCLHELQSKEAMLQEAEAKLKSYSEVDRIEALESELSYIRNSATALRDSFLLKDSVLQRIEEVLEDLDLPEYFHSKDVVEKIELLSKIVAGNSSFTMNDWDKKSSIGGSHSDAGFVVMDSWRDDSQAISNPEFDELKSKYEQLERKFYGLAEHNDMLEQSLVERNSLVQKWEEMLDKLDVPPQFSILEPEDKIEWLGKTLSETQDERDALQMKIENLEASSDMLVVDLEESYKKLSEVSAEVVAIKSEKDFLSESLSKLNFEYLGLSEKVAQHDIDRENFQREIDFLQKKLAEKIQGCDMEKEIWRLINLVGKAFYESDMSVALSDGNAIKCLEELVSKLVDEYTNLTSEKVVPKDAEELASNKSTLAIGDSVTGDILHDKEQELINMRLELDKASSHVYLVKNERDEAIDRCHSLMLEIEAISRQQKLLQEEMTAEMEKNKSLLLQLDMMCKEKNALQEQLTQEEEKSASTREKLNIAVRKGKGLVQQRDGLKQEIEEMNTMIAHLKSENNQRVEAFESEKKILVNQLAEAEQNLKISNQTLSRLLRALDGIDVGTEINNTDPVQKLEEIRKLNIQLHSSLISAEQEAKKSKRAAELLLAELNEVQERADILQEELGRAEAALLEASRQKDDAESARAVALRHLEENDLLHSEESKKQVDNLVELNSGIGQIKKVCFEFSDLLISSFTRHADLLSYIGTFVDSIEKQLNCEILTDLPSDFLFHEENLNSHHAASELQLYELSEEQSVAENIAFSIQYVLECVSECNDLKRKIHKHFFSLDQQASHLLKIMEAVERKFSSQKEESDSLKRVIAELELSIRGKEDEICVIKRNLSLLYQACSDLITDIENGNSQIAENNLALVGQSVTRSRQSPSGIGRQDLGNHQILTDDSIISLVDKLFLIVKGTRNDETTELKAMISELQRELGERDVHTSRIAEELVSQIRNAEAVAKRSLTELDSAKTTICSLEKQVESMENDNRLLESRVAELKDLEASRDGLHERINSLNDSLTVKDQEIEALMEALDEEEAQVDDLENRNKELKNMVEEKNRTLDNLEASHEKTLAKLSTTVTKFDELYNLSESLVAEVENLQLQLQSQESEVSFLRQEVTRCTNELLASQEINKKHSSEVHELLKWFDMTISRFGSSNLHMNGEDNQIRLYTDILDKSIASFMAELDDLRMKVSQQTSRTLPGPSEVEQMKNESASAGIVTHMRSGRKFNNDQIAIAIDTEKDDHVIDDEDDDKAHGFKSLTMSRIIPRVSRPITDKIDGMWVSGERLLMRQPTLRLGVLMYWVALHALLASLI
ncbi:hypothetical protein MUK42_05277 [Musa troglodytarum]|uniref:Uncharacterized protein n=1 Tax=Musa troglodytarum TaxID=320322 RepID=A0A9E7I5W9_9LILI|nr:hypothetical protein MUK42_05277 [Musa troglodytarum]